MSDIVEVDVSELSRSEKHRKVMRLLAAVDTEDPDPEAVKKLERALAATPGCWAKLGGDVNRHVQDKIIERLHALKVSELAMKQGAVETRDGLGYEAASQLERLLIDHTVTCWLRLQYVEWHYHEVTGESIPLARADFWERRLSAAQRRYLRACETLARVRRLARRTPALQLNVAAQGGQQVNVAGDVEVKQASTT